MIRPATDSDLPAIDYIYNQAVSQGFCTAHVDSMSQTERTEWFRRHPQGEYPVFVYEKKGKVVGWATFSAYRPGRKALQETTEISFYTDFDHHGQGIGSELLKCCLEKAPSLNKRVLFSIIIEGNVKSIGLLEKFGFERWGYLPEVIRYNGERRAHIYMGKVLGHHSE